MTIIALSRFVDTGLNLLWQKKKVESLEEEVDAAPIRISGPDNTTRDFVLWIIANAFT